MRVGPVLRWSLVAVLLFVLFFYGAASSFHPTEAWSYVSWSLVICAAAGVIIWLIVSRPSAEPVGALKLAWQALLASIAIAVFFRMALTYALPDICTRIAGTPFTLVQAGEKGYCHFGKCRVCNLRVYMPLFRDTGGDPWHCADEDEFRVLPDKGDYEIHGRKTWLGQHIDRVTPAQ